MLRLAQQCREAGVAIEARPAQPVYRPVTANQGRRLAVADQSVIFDGRGHGRCLPGKAEGRCPQMKTAGSCPAFPHPDGTSVGSSGCQNQNDPLLALGTRFGSHDIAPRCLCDRSLRRRRPRHSARFRGEMGGCGRPDRTIRRGPGRGPARSGPARGRGLALPLDVADERRYSKPPKRSNASSAPSTSGSTTRWSPCSVLPKACLRTSLRRVTDVTYHGSVFGIQAALRHMKPRDQGTIIQIGSALAYRSIPLQSAYCGAKHAIMGFLDSLRSELIHDRSNVRLSMVAVARSQYSAVRLGAQPYAYRAQPMERSFSRKT